MALLMEEKMGKKSSRMLAILVALIMIVTMMPLTSFAKDDNAGEAAPVR